MEEDLNARSWKFHSWPNFLETAPPPIPSCYPTYPSPSSNIGHSSTPLSTLLTLLPLLPLPNIPPQHYPITLLTQLPIFANCPARYVPLPVPPRQERKFSHTLGVTALCLRRGTSAIGSQLIKHKCVNTSCILHLNDMLMLIIIRSILPAVSYAFQEGSLSDESRCEETRANREPRSITGAWCATTMTITMIMMMIYILWWSVCLFVTKNEHFPMGVSCSHL